MPSIPQYDGLQVGARKLSGGQQESNVSPEMLNAGAREQVRLGGSLQHRWHPVRDRGQNARARQSAKGTKCRRALQ